MNDEARNIVVEARDLIDRLRGTCHGTLISVRINEQDGMVTSSAAVGRGVELQMSLLQQLEEAIEKLGNSGV